MQHFIYPEKQYMHVDLQGRFSVDHDDKHGEFKFTTVDDGVRVESRLTVERAAMLAGFLLSKHPVIVKGDAMAFSAATRACDAIHEPDFTVITPTNGLRATTEEQDAKDDDPDVEVTVTSPGPLSAKRAGKEFAEQLSKVWFAKDDPQLKVPDSAPADIGDLHPDQERRLTALREVADILTGRLNNERIFQWAEWVLNGDTPTN